MIGWSNIGPNALGHWSDDGGFHQRNGVLFKVLLRCEIVVTSHNHGDGLVILRGFVIKILELDRVLEDNDIEFLYKKSTRLTNGQYEKWVVLVEGSLEHALGVYFMIRLDFLVHADSRNMG